MTKNQKKFANEYLIDLNATRAYKAVYKGCTRDEVAAAAAARLLKNVKVAEYLAERMAAREKRTEITQDKVLKELAAIAFAQSTDYARVIKKQATVYSDAIGTNIPLYDADGKPILIDSVTLTPSEELTDEQKKALAGIKEGKYGIEVSQCDKVKALELLGRHLGMFKDKVELTNLKDAQTKLDSLIDQINE